MQESFLWFDPPKGVEAEEHRKVFLERAKGLYDNLEDFRADGFRYFLNVDYKFYDPDSTNSFEKDSSDEELLLHNPYLTLNVTNSCIETAGNKIAKTKPKVTFLTKNADREQRELARKLDNWVLKSFKKGKLWDKCSQAFKSACVCGLGIIKIVFDEEAQKFCFYKVPIFSAFFDNAHKGKDTPTEIGEIKTFTLYDLIEMYPSKKKELMEGHGELLDKAIRVYEGFKEYKYHYIATESVDLLKEKWDKPIPYEFFRWEKSDQGVISVGISKKLYSIQSSITYILGKTFQSVRNFAVPRVFVPKGTSPTPTDFSNIVGEIIEVNPDSTGKGVQFSTPQVISQQVISILLMLWEKAFEIIGISALSAGGQIPRGLDKASGQAIRNYQHVESERFQLIRADYEEQFIKIAKKMIKLTNDSFLPKGVKMADIKQAKENISIWTSSLLPETPSGKLAMVGDLLNSGILSRDQAMSLFESPDVNQFMSSEISRQKAIDLLLDRALDKGENPEYYSELGLELYLDRSRKLMAQLIINMEDDKKITIIKDFIGKLVEKVSKQTAIKDTINTMLEGQPGPTQVPQNQPFTNAGTGGVA